MNSDLVILKSKLKKIERFVQWLERNSIFQTYAYGGCGGYVVGGCRGYVVGGCRGYVVGGWVGGVK